MIKKFFKIGCLVLIIIGVVYGVKLTIKRQTPDASKKEVEQKIFSMIQTKTANITSFYTYGRAFNIKGNISGVSKDNFESVKLLVTDGLEYEKEYELKYELEDSVLNFVSSNEINSGLIIDNLTGEEYYILLRLKLNNSIEPRFYSFSNNSELEDIDYYTVTKDGKNRKAEVKFVSKEIENENYNVLKISLKETSLPEDVYDIAIDAGHGGTDRGEKKGNITEADITLEYAKDLKTSLEEKGYKVFLTRTDENTEYYNYTNMYDQDGRITTACKSKAKLMISLHVNQGNNSLKGLEIYCPCNSNLEFAKTMANKINDASSIEFSNSNSFKEFEGVYVRNFTKAEIRAFAKTAEDKGYEPYPITTDTPYLYTIRETGGIATNAYVDGRNTSYSANDYYDSNQGLECYQIELGYIKNDLEIITNEKENYINAIVEAICNNY